MDALLRQVGQALSVMLGNPTIQLAATIAVAYLVIVWLATAVWVFVDARRRTRRAIVPYLSAAAVVIASPILFPLAVLVHTIVRPPTTVADRRVARLREEALVVEAERATCPSCGAPVDADWLLCPVCRTSLRHRCDECGQIVGLDWDACAWCGSAFLPPSEVVRAER
jgi:RNA polymerase subunit RPABC4/transcription elongation factor Spt4